MVEKEGIKERVDPHSIAVITTTFYKGWYPGESRSDADLATAADKLRGDLALEAVAEAQKRGYQMVVVDGGSSEEFRASLTQVGVDWREEEEKGMSGSRRQALREATRLAGVDYIAWTEPEKVSMVRDGILARAAEMIAAGEADMVIPKRTETAWKTYPEFQKISEMKANDGLNQLFVRRGLLKPTEADLDFTIGPRIMANTPELVKMFLDKYEFATEREIPLQEKIKPEAWSNFTFFPVAKVLAKGFRVVSMKADYWHPAEQTALERNTKEFEDKRNDQRNGIMAGMVYFLDQLGAGVPEGRVEGTTGRLKKVNE